MSFNQLYIKAVMNNDPSMVEYYLDAGADVHIDGDFGLIYACIYKYIEVCKIILEHGGNVHIYDNKPLKIAEKDHLLYELFKSYIQ